MDNRLRDFYFYSFAHEKELARFYASVLRPAPPAAIAGTPAPNAPANPAGSPSPEVAFPAADLPNQP